MNSTTRTIDSLYDAHTSATRALRAAEKTGRGIDIARANEQKAWKELCEEYAKASDYRAAKAEY